MNFADKLILLFRKYLPSPLSLAVLLTLFSFLLALILTSPKPGTENTVYPLQLIGFWGDGFWGLLGFAMQMMLMLVLGHVLALSKPFSKLIDSIMGLVRDTASAAFLVTLLTVAFGLFNWGFGLIFGAIFARKVGEYATRKQIPLNYGLIGAAGYAGLLVWHGGLSGSAPLKIAEKGHSFEQISGVLSMSETVFSPMNLTICAALLFFLPLSMYFLGKKSPGEIVFIPEYEMPQLDHKGETPAEKLDASRWFSLSFGLLILLTCVYQSVIRPDHLSLRFLSPNFINLMLFGLCLLLHADFKSFQTAVEDAIKGASGIMIQFPLYAGILGILASSGLIALFSGIFVEISNETTFPLLTMLSAGVVNFFVPSGGGQWAVQGGIVLEAAQQLNVGYGKAVMALAYGDELTNMLQPFWALPLLGITGLKPKDILPYAAFLMLIATVIFVVGLLVF